jgi:hypothetical protein
MKLPTLVIGLTALVIVGILAAPKKPAPTPCPAGRFLVDPTEAPLVVGGARPPIDAVELDASTGIVISSGCPAAGARVKASGKFTKVTAKWPACGSLTKVRLNAKIAAPTCNVLTGTLKAANAKPKKFDASRSACGDGVLDETLEECEPGQETCPGGVVCQECDCTPPPCEAAERPGCAGTCDPGFTCRDIFLVGCACFL